MRQNDGQGSLVHMVLIAMTIMSGMMAAGHAETLNAQKSPPVPVTFGIRALSPETPVDPQTAFVSQSIRLPDAVCSACTDQDRWTRTWTLSQMTLDRDNTRRDQGWYLFRSGLKGIGVSVKVDPKVARPLSGVGRQLKSDDEPEVGLVRTAQDTGAGLADLPAAEFTRITTFTGQDGQVKYVQEDTIRVSADLRVPTCTTSAGNLSFVLPDISQAWLRRNVSEGGFIDTQASDVRLVVANCSSNTRNLRVRFIPDGNVTDSAYGPATILVGRDTDGQDSGVGYLMKYDATGFGRTQQGIVQWDRNRPLVVTNAQPEESSDALTQGITVSLQAFYARPENGKPIAAGKITAKGLYQVSYD